MAVINLYTQAQVQTALQRATVAMLLISQKIAAQFLYFSPARYTFYKNLQYDIYNLYSAVTSELPYIGFTDAPDSYEQSYYGLVGAMIEKTRTVDVYGAYNGTTDPYYQPPAGAIVVTSGWAAPVDPIAWSDFDVATENPDGNRSILIIPAWKGLNPVLSLTSPVETALRAGTDYSILSVGGIQLLNDLSGAGSPGIADGMTLRATSYQTA